MALRDWSADLMVAVSFHWVDDEHERPLLISKPYLVGPVEYVEQARNNLIVLIEQALLASIRIGNTTALDEANDWLEPARLIGVFQTERAELAGDEDTDVVRASDVRDARKQWIRATNDFLAMLEVVDFDDDTRRRLLANYNDTEARVARAKSRLSTNCNLVIDYGDSEFTDRA